MEDEDQVAVDGLRLERVEHVYYRVHHLTSEGRHCQVGPRLWCHHMYDDNMAEHCTSNAKNQHQLSSGWLSIHHINRFASPLVCRTLIPTLDTIHPCLHGRCAACYTRLSRRPHLKLQITVRRGSDTTSNVPWGRARALQLSRRPSLLP